MKIFMGFFKAIRDFLPRAALSGLVCFVLFASTIALSQSPPPPLLPTSDAPPELPSAAVQPDAPPSALPVGPEAAPGLDGTMPVIEQTPEEIEQATRRSAFDAALQGLLPLKPEEIRELLEHFDRTQESVELPVYPAPRPEVVVETISTDPGTKPVVIKVAYGYVTTLNFVDATGAPWPIENITWAGNFDVVNFTEDSASHYIRITPQSEFAYGNMSISMLTLKTPIIISLETSRDVVHYRFDAILPENGPFAKAPLINNEGIDLVAGDVDMATVLQGVVPPSAVKLEVSGVDGRTSAYRMGGLTYLRTPLTLLSPAWMSSTASADGMRVYALNHAPVLLLSDKGKMVRAHLSDREDMLDE